MDATPNIENKSHKHSHTDLADMAANNNVAKFALIRLQYLRAKQPRDQLNYQQQRKQDEVALAFF